jgi:hypothetical protein
MPVKTKISAYSQSFKVLVDQTLSLKARNEAIAGFARRQINAADEINRAALGVVPPKKVTVNGRENAELTNIMPPESGIIVAEYRLVDDVLAWIMQTLRDRSPFDSGEYKRGHRLFADDVECDPDNPPIAARYTFFNLVPYARRLEVGKTESGRDFLISVPNKIYARTFADAKARFGNAAKITTGFESSTNSYRLKYDQPSRSFTRGFMRVSAKQRPDRVAGSVVSVPAIYVTIG